MIRSSMAPVNHISATSSERDMQGLTTGMNKDLGETGGSSCAVLTVHSLTEVDDTGPDDESPREISETMFGRVEREGGDVIRIDGVTDEAPGGMGVETKHEEKRKMMGIPEDFKSLVANLLVGGRVHKNHDKEHEVASNTAGLSVVDLLSGLLADLFKVKW